MAPSARALAQLLSSCGDVFSSCVGASVAKNEEYVEGAGAVLELARCSQRAGGGCSELAQVLQGARPTSP